MTFFWDRVCHHLFPLCRSDDLFLAHQAFFSFSGELCPLSKEFMTFFVAPDFTWEGWWVVHDLARGFSPPTSLAKRAVSFCKPELYVRNNTRWCEYTAWRQVMAIAHSANNPLCLRGQYRYSAKVFPLLVTEHELLTEDRTQKIMCCPRRFLFSITIQWLIYPGLNPTARVR